VTYNHDRAGPLESIVDRAGRQTGYQYFQDGRVDRTISASNAAYCFEGGRPYILPRYRSIGGTAVMLQIYASAVTSRHDRLLPRLAEVSEWSLWVRLGSVGPVEADIAQVGHAFSGLRGVVWHVSEGRGLSPRIRDHKRALGDWPKLAAGVVARNTLTYASSDRTVYSDVAWVSPDAYGSLANLFSQNMAGIHSTVAFIPPDERAAEQWGDIVLGLNWLWHSRRWVATSPRYAEDPKVIVRRYVQLTGELGGAAGLVAVEHAARKWLVFFGSRAILAAAEARLASGAERMETAAFDGWLQRDLYLPIAP
jgi:YD repeat-containing protein